MKASSYLTPLVKVCIDIQSTLTQRAGVGRYTRVLVQHLIDTANEDDELRLAYFNFRRKGVPFKGKGVTLKPVRWCPGRVAQFAWKTFGLPSYSRFAGRADCYHFPNFIRPPLRKGASVVTIHDMGFMRFPQFTEDRNCRYLTHKIKETAARSDAVITVSEFSAREIEELLGVDASRIFPIHHGISTSFAAPGPGETAYHLKQMALTQPYILTVGTVEPRKNLPFLVELFEKLDDFDGNLVIAGMPGWKTDPIMQRTAESTRASNIRFLDFVPDARLPALYAGAECFVFPSFYEGFGFPPLEAMACGLPVVSSTGGSLAEVLGNGAVLLDTFETDRWLDAVRRVLSDSDHRKNLIARGYRRALSYRWQDTARKTWSVYRSVASA